MKKLTALFLMMVMLLTGAGLAESTEVIVPVEEDPFVFRDVITWSSTADDIMTALAEFGAQMDESDVENLSTISFEEFVPVARTEADLYFMLWKGMPVMIEYECWKSILEGARYEDLEAGLKMKYGEPSDAALSKMDDLMVVLGDGEMLFSEYARRSCWMTSDTLISIFLCEEDDLAFCITYISLDGIETMLNELAAAAAAEAEAAAQAEYEAATSGL